MKLCCSRLWGILAVLNALRFNASASQIGIYRSECRKDALFKSSGNDKTLVVDSGSSISTQSTTSLSACAKLCTGTDSCASINYKKLPSSKQDANCQLLAVNLTDSSATLQSAPGWRHYEPVSQQAGPVCRRSPCSPGFKCIEVCNNSSGYICIDIDECLSSPCQNNATCVNKVNKYTCTCPRAYTGVNCETDINECASDPCANGGTCTDHVARYSCSCTATHTHTRCLYKKYGTSTNQETNGTIISPNYPSNYPRYYYCEWYVTVATGKRIKELAEQFYLSFSKVWDLNNGTTWTVSHNRKDPVQYRQQVGKKLSRYFPVMIVTAKLLIALIIGLYGSVHANLDVKKTLVYGPAFEADVVLPVRYFFIQAMTKHGNKIKKSVGKNPFDIVYTTDTGRARIWRDIQDRNDGSYLVRFRLYQSYQSLEISIKHQGKHVAKSPYTIKGPIYSEACNCPEHDEKKWTSVMKCPLNYTQIEKDFERFPVISLKKLRTDGQARLNKSEAMCHYSVVNNKIYRRCPGSITGFKMFVDQFLLSVLRKVKLPDVEFFANLGDWPLEHNLKDPLPIISWCGSPDTADIIWPTYDLTQSTLEALGRVSLDMMSVQGNTGPRWKEKIPKALWRGRDSRQERLDLVIMGRKKPDLYDVALSNFFFFTYDEKKYGPKNSMSFFSFFDYKYQLNIDGTVAAYRMPYLLAGDALVFKQDSGYYEHFYTDLKPWVHYIPFKRNLSDLEERLLWAKTHDNEAKQIALAGQAFARENLMPDKLYCYTYYMFKEYAKRQKSKPKYHKGMDLVQQPADEIDHCDCQRRPLKWPPELENGLNLVRNLKWARIIGLGALNFHASSATFHSFSWRTGDEATRTFWEREKGVVFKDSLLSLAFW
eukprot:gene18950-20856_t